MNKKIFFLILFLFFSFIKNEDESLSNELPICNESDINIFVSKCDKNLKQNVLFSKPFNCDSSSLNIPQSIMNIDCIECNSGEYTSYDIINKKLICLKCNKHSFSTNNFIINGELNGWTKNNIKEFNNECFIKNGSITNQFCSNFYSNDLKKIKSGNPFNYKEPIFYTAQLSKNFEVLKKSELKFKYKKGTIIKENLNKNGIFIVYLDYSIYLIDNDLKSANEYQEVTIELEKGNHTILFKYSKTVSDSISENLSLKISKIEIKNIKINNNICTSCEKGYFTLDSGSEFCQKCEDGKYFENDSCKECPIGKYSITGSGEESCIDYPNCSQKDYIKIKENKCINNKQKINNKLINLKCIEKDLKLKNYEEFIDCEECPIGKYFQNINENEKECVSCENNTYTDNINSNECKICEGTIKNVFYFEIENYSKLNKTIELEDEGLLTVDFDLIEEKEKYLILLRIDNNISVELTKNSNSYFLVKGEHNIYIKSKNVMLKSIQITNSKEGAGFQCNFCPENLKIKNDKNQIICNECEPGYEYNEKKKECIKCINNDVKLSKGNEEKCHTCPTFTTANKINTECIPYDVYYHNKENLKFYIKQYEEIQNIICSYKKLCYNTLFGPINDNNNDLYFFSFQKSTHFKNIDYVYRYYENLNKYKKSYFFLLKNLDNFSNENDFIKNKKYLISLGSEIENIKLLKNNNNRGVFIHYNNGDKCIEDNTKNYETYLFLKCKNDHNNKKNMKGPKFINKAECVYYFEWEGRGGCPICLSEEIEKIEFQCRNWERNVSFFENNHCLVYNTSQFLGDNIGFSDKEIIITENDMKLLNIYNINYQVNINNNKNGYFVENILMTEFCTLLHDYDSTIFKIVICFFIFYGFLIFILVLYIIKYKRTIKSYSKLNNEDDNHSIFEENKRIKGRHPPQIIEISVERNYEKQ